MSEPDSMRTVEPRGLGREAAEVHVEDAPTASQRLRISVTDRCNFRCFFCHNEGQTEGSERLLGLHDFERIARACSSAGIKSIKLTGGEPLTYRVNGSDLSDVVRAITSGYNGNPVDVSVTTNGWFLKRHIDSLRDAGLTRITISLSSLDERTHSRLIHGRTGSPSVIYDAIVAAVDAGFTPVKVNTVIFRSASDGQGNLQEIPSIIKACHDAGVHELRLYPIIKVLGNSAFRERYQYWDNAMVSTVGDGLIECAPDADVEHAIEILSDVTAGLYDEIAARTRFTLFVPVGGSFRLALNMMSAYRSVGHPCSACTDPQLCQEGIYALRMSAGGNVRTCLNAAPIASMGELLRIGASDEELAKAMVDARTVFVSQHAPTE